MSNKYWAERMAKAQQAITSRGIKATEKQLIKYYQRSMQSVIGQFQSTYNKLLADMDKGKEPTPADLYKLDKYWQMQGQLDRELRNLGNRQLTLFSKSFVNQYQSVYEALARKDGAFFSEVDKKTATQMINQIWCADGKSWSSRIWANTDRLKEALNNGLIDCLVTGKRASDLKHMLQDVFNVSFNRADSIVRTEMAHIQTQAAQQRYKDYGIQEVEILADEDERRCEICGKLHGKHYPVGAAVPIPAHPKCRCCIIPVA